MEFLIRSPSVLHVALLFFSIPTLLSLESATLSIATDKEALISFKSLLTVEPPFPNPLSSWDPTSSPCNWTGILCSPFNRRVIALNLSGSGLSGSISPHIGNLSFLRSLQLQNNRLNGPLPAQISNLFRLRVLNISLNSMEGAIPSNLSQLRDLRALDLTSNRFSGIIPTELSNLRSLQVLKLGRNRISGVIPPAIANLSSLTELNFGTNSIAGLIPGELGGLRNLKWLDLTINNLTGTVPDSIYNMSSLVYIGLASNQLWGKIPNNVGDTLPKLLGFNFCINKFTGTIPGSLHNLSNIQIIRMAHNLLEGTVPPGLGNLPFLQMYNIGYNKITSSGDDGLSFIDLLTNSTRLSFLAVDGNRLEGLIPESVGNLSKVLTKLYMGENRIYGRIPASIGRLSSLALLNLSYNSISGDIPVEVGQLKGLQTLSLARNNLSGRIPDSLSNLQNLNHIDLSSNELVGRIPAGFGNFQRILSMDLSNNRFNGSLPTEMLALPSLTTLLNLSKNQLNGPLPEVGNLESVVAIDLSDNSLSGNITSSIRNCKSLEKLFMAKNMLSGPIPSSLGTLKGLETLDLSLNQLSGSIPVELQNLNALQSLNLSFNDLEGEVPTSGIFSKNLSSVHLEGNPKLCFHRFSSCGNGGGHGRRLIYVVIAVALATIVALSLIIGFLFFVKKGRVKAFALLESLKGQCQMVSYNELREATAGFSQQNLVGSGSFGSVYKGVLKGVEVAIKVLDIERTGSKKSFVAECEALRNVRHRNLVKLITSCSSLDSKNNEFLGLVYEFLSRGSLEDWIRGKRKHENGEGLNVAERLNVAIDVACAMDYLHHDSEAPVVHCDLKPSNVLLGEDMTAKVGDFGLARLLLQRGSDQAGLTSTNGLRGSVGYIPPEYGMGEKASTAGDVYSYGVMLLELFTGKSPTHEDFEGGLSLSKWVQWAFPHDMVLLLDPELPPLMGLSHDADEISPKAQLNSLVTVFGVGLSCTVESPDGRITMREALRKLKAAREGLVKMKTSP
ncbi:putative receptor-like protein kinase At3g47110 [Malania oleifera]|uniref:putative receptor-like protein kinase At3g47110 n=1 Tax=Malania oleifera TaxID=397392 RepID=UPI0025AE477C|nr:putative receptor-like protein kinase At3g47110 [Malania oleifera]